MFSFVYSRKSKTSSNLHQKSQTITGGRKLYIIFRIKVVLGHPGPDRRNTKNILLDDFWSLKNIWKKKKKTWSYVTDTLKEEFLTGKQIKEIYFYLSQSKILNIDYGYMVGFTTNCLFCLLNRCFSYQNVSLSTNFLYFIMSCSFLLKNCTLPHEWPNVCKQTLLWTVVNLPANVQFPTITPTQ